MTVKVSFVVHFCDVEFSDEMWMQIENAANASGQTVEKWIVSTINDYVTNEKNVSKDRSHEQTFG